MANPEIDKLIWRFSGADPYLAHHSGDDSKVRFRMIGISFLFIIVITFLPMMFGLMKIFDAYILPFFVAGFVTFLIVTIYRLNILSLEPNTLPYISGKGSLSAANIVRFSVIVMFGFLVSKQFEFLCFSWLVSEESLSISNVQRNYLDQTEYRYMAKMIVLNTQRSTWFVWLITPVVLFLFLLPTRVKYKLRRNEKEYYRIKSIVDKRIVEEDYSRFKIAYKSCFANQKMPKVEFNDATYFDPPYNTKRKKANSPKNQNDFFQSFK